MTPTYHKNILYSISRKLKRLPAAGQAKQVAKSDKITVRLIPQAMYPTTPGGGAPIEDSPINGGNHGRNTDRSVSGNGRTILGAIHKESNQENGAKTMSATHEPRGEPVIKLYGDLPPINSDEFLEFLEQWNYDHNVCGRRAKYEKPGTWAPISLRANIASAQQPWSGGRGVPDYLTKGMNRRATFSWLSIQVSKAASMQRSAMKNDKASTR